MYDKGSPAYLVYFPQTQAIKRCRIVRFSDKFEIESEAPKQTQIILEQPMIVNMPASNQDQSVVTEGDNTQELNVTTQEQASEHLCTQYILGVNALNLNI